MHSQIDPRGNWRTLQTPHFRVHVRAEHRALGLIAAVEAESAWAALGALLPAPRRVDLVLTDNIDFANGFASTYPVPRVVIYALPPAGDLQLGVYDRWLRMVIVHELAHIFHLDLARGWWGIGRKLLGRAPFLFPNQYAPGWVREGAAVFYESRITGAGRLEGSFHRAVVEAGAREQGGVSLSEATLNSEIWPGGIRAYSHGGTFMGEAAERSGDSSVARFLKNGAGVVLPYFQLSSAFKRATSVGIGRVWREWQGREGTEGTEGTEGNEGTILLRGLRIAVAPRVSPDGRRLALVHSDGNDATRLRIIDLATRSHRDVSRLNSVGSIAWENDSSLLVTQAEFTDPYTLRSDLYRIGLDGREQRLTHGARLLSFDARDGIVVAVRAVPGGTELVELSLSDPSTITMLFPAAAGTDWSDPRLSDAHIAVVRVRGGWHDIVLIDRRTRDVFPLTSDSVRDLAPAFARSGVLAWSREVDSTPQIVTSGGVVLTREPYAAFAPALSGDTTFYLAYHGDGFALSYARGGQGGVSWSLANAPSVRPIPADSAPETRYSSARALLPRFWIPVGFIQTDGAWLGALTAGSDPLERHAYAASVEIGTGIYGGDWRGNISYAHAGPGVARFDASLSRERRLFVADTATGALGCCASDESAGLGLTFVRRRWRTSSALRTGLHFDRDAGIERAGGTMTISWANTITPALAISTQDGARWSASLRARRRLDQPLASADLSVRVSTYRSIRGTSLFARPVFALRASATTLVGNDRIAFGVGGESGSPVAVVPGLLTVGLARSHPVRGYPGSFLTGRHVGSVSLEQRVPLVRIARNAGLFPVGIHHVSATLFGDAGVAYSRAYCGTGSDGRCAVGIASAGGELSTVIALGYDFPIAMRVGMAARLNHLNGVAFYGVFGSSF